MKIYQVKDLQSKSLEDATVRSRLTIYLTLLSSSNYKESFILKFIFVRNFYHNFLKKKVWYIYFLHDKKKN